MADAGREELRRRRDERLAVGSDDEPPEVTVRGVVRWLDLEGGAWVVDVGAGGDVSEGVVGGERWQLLGEVEPGWSGREVVVSGVLRRDLVTTAQVGPVLVVRSGTVADG